MFDFSSTTIMKNYILRVRFMRFLLPLFVSDVVGTGLIRFAAPAQSV